MPSKFKKCALAAAYSAVTGTDESVSGAEVIDVLQKVYPMCGKIVQCPCGCNVSNHLVHLIPHLNDAPNCWTREKIADWVKTHEDAELDKSKIGAISEADKIMADAWRDIEARKKVR